MSKNFRIAAMCLLSFILAVPGDISAKGAPSESIRTFTIPASLPERVEAAVDSSAAAIPAEERAGAWQVEAALAVTRIREAIPNAFASAAIDRENRRLTIGTKSVAPEMLRSALGAQSFDTVVRQDVGWSEAEIVEGGNAAHYSVAGSVSDAESVDTDIDSASGAIRITVTAPARGAFSTLNTQDLRRKVSTKLAERVPGNDFTVTLSVSATSSPAGYDALHGGGSLTSCTAAFSVRASGYAHGLLTAGHCGNTQSYGSSKLIFRDAVFGSLGDAQWHSANTATDAQFYSDSGVLRAVTSTADPVVGQNLCKYGKTTGYTCDEVYKLNQCSGEVCGLVMTHNRRADGGDSGGPWFYNNTAFGVHSGYKTYLLKKRDLFSPVRQVAKRMSVTVKTG